MKTIEFTKYFNCPDCRASVLYCPQHRIEVEKILEQADDLERKKATLHRRLKYKIVEGFMG